MGYDRLKQRNPAAVSGCMQIVSNAFAPLSAPHERPAGDGLDPAIGKE
jgi:hypothetical protein